MTLKARWIDFLYRAATGSRRFRNVSTPIGAMFFGLLLLCFVVLSRHIDRLIGVEDFLPGRLHFILSLPLFAVAALLIGWSVGRFRAAGGTPVPINPPPRLVVSGPYAHSRNPMLAGVFALLFGLGVLLESATLLFAFTPLFIALMVWELKAIEEPELVKRLGREYVEYREKTPMFFPRIIPNTRKRKNSVSK
jgi:protein-S-isoprenylcysteine O-methyltransferase Ste14